jgi:hypothetical protein
MHRRRAVQQFREGQFEQGEDFPALPIVAERRHFGIP